MLDDGLSPHPVDTLIRELLATGRAADPVEIDLIIARIAGAPFDPRLDAMIPTKDRGLSYRGTTLGARDSALTYHLIKRVVGDRQWADGTTADQYVDDLHQAVRAADARLVLYRRRGGRIAAVLSRNRIDPVRRGLDSSAWILIVFSADRGTIITGYQLSTPAPLNIPEDARWLS
jgi:hypothetical protein